MLSVTRPILVRRPPPASAEPRWDEAARLALERLDDPAAGMLRLLGGPGTGKTTLLVESVLRRLRAGRDPERLLVLVGSRRAAGELRERITAGLLVAGPGGRGGRGGQGGRGGLQAAREPLVRTIHSYAFGLLRGYAARVGDPPPRLLAGPEQDAVVRELLAGELAGDVPGSGWPDRLLPALGVPGFATELRELLLRAAERGLGPYELAELGARTDVPEWVAAGRFFLRYEQVNLLRGASTASQASQSSAGSGATAPALDAAELVAAALDVLTADPGLLAEERHRVRHLWVDDAHDLDPQQMQLARMLGDTAETFLLTGDPDLTVLGFRGADPGALRDADPDGDRTVILTVDHRARPALRRATVRLAERLPGSGSGRRRVGPESLAAPASAAPRVGAAPDVGAVPDVGVALDVGATLAAGAAPSVGTPPEVGAEGEALGGSSGGEGTLAVRVFASAAQEAGWVADRLRRAHLRDGVAWSDMAVLVRSTNRALPVLRRALLAAGVPMAVPADELPLARQPAVLPLLLLLRCAADPERIDADAAVALLSSPLGAADPLRLRRLRRGLLRLSEPLVSGDGRHGDTPHSQVAEGDTAGSDALLVEALRAGAHGEVDPLSMLPARDTKPLRAVAELLGLARAADEEGASAEEALWRVWQASGLAGRWAVASARRGPVGAQADRDLDAVVALFDAAARYTDRLPGGGDIGGFLQYVTDQRIAGDTLAPRAPSGDAVAVLTAHAARGREWEVVVIPSVQEGSWPDPRLRGTLLGVERMVDALDGLEVGPADAATPEPGPERLSRVAPLVAEERRLFYLACSRARRALLVSGVRGEDEQPSRFLDELEPYAAEGDEPDATRPVTRPPRALVLAELVGELRRAACDPETDDARRARAAQQLARLAAAGVRGAHPDDWYGLAKVSTEHPLRDPDQPVPMSPSDLEKIMKCPLKWLLERHGGDDGAALPSVTGSLVHALVQAAAEGSDDAELDTALRRAWSSVDAGAPWYSRRELDRVRGMLAAFRGWLTETRAAGLTEVAVERGMNLALAGEPEVQLRGRVDRLERDADGRPVIVDVKTGKTAISKDDAAAHPQLAMYQLAAALGGFRDALRGPGPAGEPGGARLLFLADRGADGRAKEREQPALDAEALEQWRGVLHQSAAQTGAATFTARENGDCERCGVRTSCPVSTDGRGVPGG